MGSREPLHLLILQMCLSDFLGCPLCKQEAAGCPSLSLLEGPLPRKVGETWVDAGCGFGMSRPIELRSIRSTLFAWPCLVFCMACPDLCGRNGQLEMNLHRVAHANLRKLCLANLKCPPSHGVNYMPEDGTQRNCSERTSPK